MKVIVADDSPEVVDVIKLCLSMRWPECCVTGTPRGGDVMRLVEREAPSLVLLDLDLQDRHGLEVLRELRKSTAVPVIVVSGYGDEVSRVRGLEEGADDYIVKPFSHTELLARVRAVLRRVERGRPVAASRVVSADGMVIDLDRRRLSVDGQAVELTRSEWSLLAYFVENRGKVISTHNLATAVWGSSYVEGSAIRMCIARLRRKLACNSRSHELIRSHRGFGYTLDLHP